MGIFEKLFGNKSKKTNPSPKADTLQTEKMPTKKAASGPVRSPIWFCGPMGELIEGDLKQLGLWEQVYVAAKESQPKPTWFPSQCWYDQEKGIYHLEEASRQQWCFCEKSLSYHRSHWEGVTPSGSSIIGDVCSAWSIGAGVGS